MINLPNVKACRPQSLQLSWYELYIIVNLYKTISYKDLERSGPLEAVIQECTVLSQPRSLLPKKDIFKSWYTARLMSWLKQRYWLATPCIPNILCNYNQMSAAVKILTLLTLWLSHPHLFPHTASDRCLTLLISTSAHLSCEVLFVTETADGKEWKKHFRICVTSRPSCCLSAFFLGN